jgi:hypothetical protein
MGDTEGAYAAFIRATALDPYAGFAFTNAAHMAALSGRMEAADTLARRASALEMADLTPRWRLGRAFAAGDVHTAAALCDSLLAASPTPGSVADDAEICGSIDIASGRVGRGLALLEAVTETYLQAGRWRNVAHAAHALAVGHTLTGDPARAADRLEAVTARIPAEGFVEPDRFITRTNLRVHAALLGETELVERIAATYPPYPDPSHWFARFAESLVRAAEAVASRDGASALRALDEGRTEGLMPIGWRVWDALLRGLAHEALGDPSAAAPYFHHAAEPGYLLLPYLAKDRVLLPLALMGLARVEAGAGDQETSARGRLNRLFALADPEVRRLAP